MILLFIIIQKFGFLVIIALIEQNITEVLEVFGAKLCRALYSTTP